MTDSIRPARFDDEDELLSASIDGVTTAEEEAHILADPHLVERRQELAAAAALVATPVPSIDEARREAVISTALAVAETRPERVAPVIDLTARRRSRLMLVSAAAAVLVIAIGVVRVLQRDDSSSTVAFDAKTSTQLEAGTAGQAATRDSARTYLGSFTSNDDLVAATRVLLSGPAPAGNAANDVSGAQATTTAAAPLAAAGQCNPLDPNEGAVVFDGTATLDGQPVRVVVQDDGSGTRQLSVIDASCAVIAHEPL